MNVICFCFMRTDEQRIVADKTWKHYTYIYTKCLFMLQFSDVRIPTPQLTVKCILCDFTEGPEKNGTFAVVSYYARGANRLSNFFGRCFKSWCRQHKCSPEILQENVQPPPFCTTGGLLQRTRHWMLIYISNTEYNCKGFDVSPLCSALLFRGC